MRGREREGRGGGRLVHHSAIAGITRNVRRGERRTYDPAMPPPRAAVIYIGSDLPILCITRAQIVIGPRASQVQSSGMLGRCSFGSGYTVFSLFRG